MFLATYEAALGRISQAIPGVLFIRIRQERMLKKSPAEIPAEFLKILDGPLVVFLQKSVKTDQKEVVENFLMHL